MEGHINLHRIEAFLAVAESRNMSRAAVQLEIAQSVVSRHIGALETELGCRLFVRNGRGVGMTEAAQRLAPRLKAALEEIQCAMREVADDGGQPSGSVKIGIVPSISQPLVGKLYDRIAEAYPRVRLQFIEGFSDQLEQWLLDGAIDVAVLNRYGRVHRPGEQRLGVLDSLVIGPARAFGQGEDLAFKDLAQLPLVLPSRPNGLRVLVDQIARRLGVQLQVAAEADSVQSMKTVVEYGHVYAILPYRCVQEEVAAGTLTAARLVKPGIPRSVSLATAPRQVANSQATSVVAHEIRQFGAQGLFSDMRRAE